MTASTHYLTLTPRDPILARDSRPFTGGQRRVRSLDWPYPSVLAGSLRTMLGKQAGSSFDATTIDKLKALQIAGPLPMVNGKLYLPAPADFVFDKGKKKDRGDAKAWSVRPAPVHFTGASTDLPVGLAPAVLPNVEAASEFKPGNVPAFWSVDEYVKWLCDTTGENFEPSFMKRKAPVSEFLAAPEKDERSHVAIDPNTNAAAKSMLFATTALDLAVLETDDSGVPTRLSPIEMSVRVRSDKGSNDLLEYVADLDDQHPFGGERRLMHWRTAKASPSSWSCPKEVRESLSEKDRRYVRMMLATPAIFAHGWKPGWLEQVCTPRDNTSLEGRLLDLSEGIRLRLISAVVPRWQAVSGWSYETDKWGPKPIRRLAPAGSVYFFEVLDGDPATLADRWLEPVSDDPQDRQDGFGLAVWGVWGHHKVQG